MLNIHLSGGFWDQHNVIRDYSFSGISISIIASHLYALLVGAVVQIEVASGQVLDSDQPGE